MHAYSVTRQNKKCNKVSLRITAYKSLSKAKYSYFCIYVRFKLRLENFDTGIQFKEKAVGTEMDIQRRDARTSRLLKERNKVFRERMLVTQISSERMETNVLKCYGHVV